MKPLSRVAQSKVDSAFLRAIRTKVLMEQQGKCAYCRDQLTTDNATADHMQPRCKGGSDHISNIMACCAPCNSLKGSKSVGEFMRLVKNPEQHRGPFFYTWLRRRLNLRIERAERRILAYVGRAA